MKKNFTRLLHFGFMLIFWVSISTAVSQPAETLIEKGPLAGATIKIVNRTTNSLIEVAHSQLMVSQDRTNWLVAVDFGGKKTNLTTRLCAYAYDVLINKNGTNTAKSFFAMAIESQTEPLRWWFCSRPTSDTMPRDFKVFTTQSGSTYACYIDYGIKIFQVKALKDEATAWQEYWERNQETPDAITPLGATILRQALPNAHWYHYNPSYSTAVVDDIIEVEGELRVILHTIRPEPKHIFAFRDNTWVWISSTGKEMPLDQIYEVRNKAIGDQFDAEMSAKSEGKNPYEGMTAGQIAKARDNAINNRIEALLRTKSDQTNNTSGVQTNK